VVVEMHSPDDEAADSAAPFGGKPPPLFGGERSRRTVSITRAAAAGKTPSAADYLKARGAADYSGTSRVGLMQCWAAASITLNLGKGRAACLNARSSRHHQPPAARPPAKPRLRGPGK